MKYFPSLVIPILCIFILTWTACNTAPHSTQEKDTRVEVASIPKVSEGKEAKSEEEGSVQDPYVGELLSSLPNGTELPEHMVFVPGGIVEQGAADGLAREQPVLPKPIKGFFMDISPVTVAQFRSFVEATGYLTESERFGNSIIHDMKGERGWYMEDGANWKFPLGPTQAAAPGDHPVTHVSYNDALAYCKWAGKRLPTEAEWEHAARNGNNSRSHFSWGQEIREGNLIKANYWQGTFPYLNTNEDGFMYTSPVGSFGETELGLKDMAGNVWEWCSDWYRYYGENGEFIETTPGQKERVMRGGSFMCAPNFCQGYRVSGRSGTTPESALFHLGFRCVKDI